jgi:HK97 family phage portal protein
MFKNMEICLHDIKTGEKIEDHPVLKLLANPNPLQNREQWLTQLSIQRDIWTQAFIYQLRPIQIMKGAAPLPAVLWNLPPNQIEINRTGKMWDQTKLDGIITNYKLLDGSNKTFTPEEVIQISDHTGESYITGESKIISMRTVISNLDGALKTRNCIINDRGALGILSNATKDGDGGLPIDAKERERIEREYRTKYGLSDGQMKLMITNASLNWQPMSYPTKELALFEEVEEDFGGLCGTFGMARDIFPSTKGATFENQVEAFKQTYQNTLQPQADQLMRTFNNRWGLYAQGIELRAEYAWLPVMKEDELKEQQAQLAKAQTQSQMLRDGVINKEQYAQAFGITVEDVDASLAQAAGLANAQTQLRGTVGGLTGIISLNAAVGQRQMTREAAVNTLVNYYGYEQSIAESMITDTTNESSIQSTQNTGTENQPA